MTPVTVKSSPVWLARAVATGLLACACSPQPPSGPVDSANLTKAKALVEATAKDFERAAAAADDAAKDPEKARAIGARLRKDMEGRRSDGEALQRVLTDDEKRKLQDFGLQRLAPAVRKLEDKLGTAGPQPAPTTAAPAAPAPASATPAAR